MISVSQAFKDAIQGNPRKLYAKAEILFTDPFVTRSITITPGTNAYTSYPDQTANNKTMTSYKIISLDGYNILDGSYRLAPSEDDTYPIEMGWWSEQISEADGTFTTNPYLLVEFEPSTIAKIAVAGDIQRSEYPVHFKIDFKDNSETVIHTIELTDNSDVIWEYEFETPLTDIAKLELTIYQWNKPYTNSKIVEFFTTLHETYYNDDIVKFDVLEEIQSEDAKLMVSGVSTNQLQLSLYNRDKRFSAGNTDSPLSGALKPHRKVTVYLSYKDFQNDPPASDEQVTLGEFWTTEWNVPEDKLFVSLTAQDKLTLLGQSLYRTSVLKYDVTLYELAEDVLTDAGLATNEYVIDTALQNYIIPYGYFKVMTHWQALQRIAQACLGYIYCGRDGRIHIKAFDTMFQGGSVASLTKSNYFKKSNPIQQKEIVNYVEVTIYPLTEETQTETIYDSSVPIPIEADETKTVTIEYKEIPSEVTITAKQSPAGFTITNIDYYSWGADVTVYSPNAGDFILKADGNPIKQTGKEIAIVTDETSIKEHGVLKYTIQNCHLIQKREHAEELANKAIQISSLPRRTFTIDWRGDPTLELGDKISVTDDFETADCYIVRQEFQYDGTLRSRIIGRRTQ